MAGCGGTPVEPVVAPEPDAPPIGELALLVPEGPELIVVARPAALMAESATREVTTALFPDAWRDAFGRRTGVEPDEIEELVWAQTEPGYLVLARGPWAARDVVLATESRMNSLELRQEEPFLRRVGFLGTDRRDLVAIGEREVMMGAEAPAEARSALLSRVRRGSWAESSGAALAREAVAGLWSRASGAPVTIVVPQPLELPPGFDTALLLARQRALTATLRPVADGPEHLDVEVELAGEFPPGARENFENLVISVGESDLGRVLGIGEGLSTLEVTEEEDRVVIGIRLRAASLAEGLRVLLYAELVDLFDDLPEQAADGPNLPESQ